MARVKKRQVRSQMTRRAGCFAVVAILTGTLSAPADGFQHATTSVQEPTPTPQEPTPPPQEPAPPPQEPTPPPQEATPASPDGTLKLDKSFRKNVPDFGEVTERLYRGGQPSKEGFRLLAEQGVKIVVDQRGSRDDERKIVTELGMEYVPIPWFCLKPRDEVFAEFLRLLRKNPGKKVFVHCRVGDDRTGAMIAIYRMAEEGWSAQRAKDEMERYHYNFVHRHLICPPLAEYVEKFPETFKTSLAFTDLH